ncbi:MAG TPA: nucleotidyltransferase family protein [Blastocatellia bacterium]|nr:nucleotidyltransferase family protein [Blastocatellia bacterium]
MANKSSKDTDPRRGRLVASTLAGSWLPSPPPAELSEEQLAEVAPLLLNAGSGGLAWRRVRGAGLRDSSAAFELQQAYRLFALQSALHERDIRQVVPLLESFGIDAVMVKGWPVAELYPDPGARPYGDLDLCVRPDQYDLAAEVFRRPENRGFVVDLHRGFGNLDERPFDELFARSQSIKVGGVDVRIPAAEDHLRILCAHLMRHGAVRPLWLCDVAVMLDSLPDDFDWDLCLGDGGSSDMVACSIGLAHALLGARAECTPVKERALSLPGWMVPSVLRQWEVPFKLRRPMLTYLNDPVGALREARHHWPNPIEATVGLRASFNELPRLPFQLANCISRTAKLLARLPARLRD